MGLLLVLSSASCGDSDSASPDAMTTDARMTDTPPYDGDLFVNGAFNDWGAPGKKVTFQYAGDGLYIARARMPAGLHLFKITDAVWSAERTFSAATDHVVTIGLDEPTPLTAAPGEGNHTNLAASKAAVYEFRLSVDQDPDAPTLVIIEDAPPYAAGMFLQGSFNDWGSEGNELPFIYFGDGRYAITVELAAGQHELRLSDGTPERTFSASTEAEHGIAFDVEVPLVAMAPSDASTSIDVAEAGAYTFVLTASRDLDAPSLLVRAAAAGEQVSIVSHRDAIATATQAGLPGSGVGAAISIAEDAQTRTYTLSTTQTLRQIELPSYVRIPEHADDMRARSGNLMFDGLFALALDEVRQARISQINDGSFEPADCECFETGAQWHFVWTRDTAYSVDLSLALVDPVRAMNSLLFKTGAKRVPGDGNLVSAGPEIVQDTGSGGSWPISSDRVVWSLGAFELLKYLDGTQRETFRDQVYEIVTSTIVTDRNALYDSRDGLYRGEQSFLDWREQTYPLWVANDVVHIGMAKALSTNVGHYAILSIAAELAAEKGDAAAQATYQTMADALKAAINQHFWLEDVGLYSSLKHTEIDPAVLGKFDLLGQSLAMILGVADPTQTSRILASYPHTAAGAPVIWPQQPDVPIYHNRAIWPFVSAYALRAARQAGNDAVVEHNIASLMRAAALNLSNMENLEYVTGLPTFYTTSNPALGGPVLNSRRQLWSVAGYISMVVDVVFGLESTQEGLRFAPFITRNMRNTLFAGSDVIELQNLQYRGKRIDVRVQLPPGDGGQGGYYEVSSVTLNGAAATPDIIMATSLEATNLIEIGLTLATDTAASITVVDVADPGDVSNQDVFAPREPRLVSIAPSGAGLKLDFDSNGEPGTVFNVYRNGERVASGLEATTYQDDTANVAGTTYCYAVEQVFTSSRNASHHSPPLCHDLTAARDVLAAGTALESVDGATTMTANGITYFPAWGTPEQTLQVEAYTPETSGEYLLSVTYSNTWAHLSTGITGAVKRVEIVNAGTDETVAAGVVQMPQLVDASFGESSYLPVSLEAGTAYRITVSDYFNMSYLDFFAIYRGRGGAEGALNSADIAALNVTRMR